MRLLHQAAGHAKYAVAATELTRMCVATPGFQRDRVDEHVAAIVAFERASVRRRGACAFVGCIVLCALDGELFCIDGQHRLCAIRTLLEDGALDFEVVVEVVQCADAAEAEEWFRVVNASRPVPAFVLAVSAVGLRLRRHLRSVYAPFLSASARPRRPNVNADAFVDAVLARHPQLHADGVERWLDERNDEHRAALASARGADASVDRAFDAASRRERPLFLGIAWLDAGAAPRRALGAALRRLVWHEWYDALPAERKRADGGALCPCCEREPITPLRFHVGHRTSRAHGGSDAPPNLVPLCATCNLSMGVRDFDAFRASLR